MDQRTIECNVIRRDGFLDQYYTCQSMLTFTKPQDFYVFQAHERKAVVDNVHKLSDFILIGNDHLVQQSFKSLLPPRTQLLVHV